MHSKVVMKDKMYPVTYSCYVLLYQLQINLTSCLLILICLTVLDLL